MQAKIMWVKAVSFAGETGSGHSVVMDGPPEAGGDNQGPRPMELVLLGLGGCSAFDVVTILKKGRHSVTNCEVEISAERSESIPKVFTKIHMRYIVSGDALSTKAVERAVSLSAEKYCSVSRMLEQSVALSHDYEVRDSIAQ